MTTTPNDWMTSKIKYVEALKSPTQAQALLVALSKLEKRTGDQQKTLDALIKAEKAAEKAAAAKVQVKRLMEAEKKAEAKELRKARTHELCQSAGLMIVAGLVDAKTGKPKIDNGSLLGALSYIAGISKDDPLWMKWKMSGDIKLAAATAAKKAT